MHSISQSQCCWTDHACICIDHCFAVYRGVNKLLHLLILTLITRGQCWEGFPLLKQVMLGHCFVWRKWCFGPIVQSGWQMFPFHHGKEKDTCNSSLYFESKGSSGWLDLDFFNLIVIVRCSKLRFLKWNNHFVFILANNLRPSSPGKHFPIKTCANKIWQQTILSVVGHWNFEFEKMEHMTFPTYDKHWMWHYCKRRSVK